MFTRGCLKATYLQRYLPTVRLQKEVPWMVTMIMLEDYRNLHKVFMTPMVHVNQP
jgi:hypothetical protein